MDKYIESIEGDYIIRKYSSGVIVQTLITQETAGQIIELPKNPIISLQEENSKLKVKIDLMQKALDDLAMGGM